MAFTSPAGPQSVSVPLGGTLNLDGLAQGGEGAIFYQWLQNGVPIAGQTTRNLTLTHFTAALAGTYKLRARAGTTTVESSLFAVTLQPAGQTPDGFALIPAGEFLMGQDGIATPVHTVQVSAFYMAKYEVTKELWDAVRTWGLANGYTDLAVGNDFYASKGANHPVHRITW